MQGLLKGLEEVIRLVNDSETRVRPLYGAETTMPDGAVVNLYERFFQDLDALVLTLVA